MEKTQRPITRSSSPFGFDDDFMRDPLPGDLYELRFNVFFCTEPIVPGTRPVVHGSGELVLVLSVGSPRPGFAPCVRCLLSSSDVPVHFAAGVTYFLSCTRRVSPLPPSRSSRPPPP